ncbi:MAG: DNA polymerase subunit beta [uncultured bacterium]|nr:MAG: DNA polymerase subunit beta [uncultured bacterium]
MDRKTIKKPLSKFVRKTVRIVNPEKIILYGSFARGNASQWSDIDLVVIGKKKLNYLEKIAGTIDSRFIFDIRGYKKDEFEKISPLSIYSEIKREGIVIYSKN